ncbi:MULTISPECIES: lipopolysaccharide transport periplasmic protein LptA [Gammaproteobacteria]|uniref:lipopolysaccharide transport periplasmic protein LptA n=1 Tax=Gammaproteobacteria TaxID=1236 RepID=UPI000DD08FD7|nr:MULTISPECIES: lipopolysaccharide transport periplasmic protein LptA [Gammaproteobacteria]RTE86351.1 lipopolysaccharide transport periplasmic protein LptA [Aliidiomarina sp. B3213]TCZ91701.1 lipopolysaccharide transport periplasmic protein LptA [Lysobacter sp. N42]
MWKAFTTLALLLATNLLATPASAQSSQLEEDFRQPVHVSSDRESLDLRENIYVAEGHVEIKQGSLTILADRLEVQGFSNEEAPAEKFVAVGTPATYSQEIAPGIIVTASANEIIYDATLRTLTLTGNAELFQSGNQLKAATITYNIGSQQVSAERDESQRVQTTFQPRESDDSTEENSGNNN